MPGQLHHDAASALDNHRGDLDQHAPPDARLIHDPMDVIVFHRLNDGRGQWGRWCHEKFMLTFANRISNGQRVRLPDGFYGQYVQRLARDFAAQGIALNAVDEGGSENRRSLTATVKVSFDLRPQLLKATVGRFRRLLVGAQVEPPGYRHAGLVQGSAQRSGEASLVLTERLLAIGHVHLLNDRKSTTIVNSFSRQKVTPRR